MPENLTQEAMEVRRGADDVREQFERLLRSGNPSIFDLSYAVKSRVKDDFKIEEKVRKKRSTDKPHYKTKDIRDIVGIRIVTLYRLDILSIIPNLLKLIAEHSGGDESRFFLDNPIEEVKVYSINSESDVQKLGERIRSMFNFHGFSERCLVETERGNYSSLHIVLWTRTKYAKGYVEVPVEIQIRTALEDVWSEMDHQLKYKRETKSNTGTKTEAMISNCLAHLNVLKTLNDGLAQYGDQVKIQIDELDESIKRRSRIRLAEEPERRLINHETYEGEVKERIRDILGRSREALSDENNSLYKSTKKIADFQISREIIEKGEVDLREVPMDDNLRLEVEYVLAMEKALLLYEIGRRLGASAGNEYLVESHAIYQKMYDSNPARGIIAYRLARVLYELNDREQARLTMKNLLDNFERTDLQENHWVHASANRILGYWLWNDVRRVGSDLSKPLGEDERSVAVASAVYSAKASEITVSDKSQPNEYPHESDRVMAQSNLLFFVVEFLEAGGEWAELEQAGISNERFATALAEVSQFDESDNVDYHKLNTLRRVYLFQEDIEQAKRYARLAIANLEAAGYLDRGSDNEPEYVLRECVKTISL
ncbi:hypothetical protein ACXYL9_06125 [Qipengyuania sp. CAU 1752]